MYNEMNDKERNFYNQFPSKLTLYSYLNPFGFKSVFFDTEEELNKYTNSNDTTYGYVCKIEFLGNILGKNNVIRRILKNGNIKLFTIYSDDVYEIYDYKYSTYFKEPIWNYEFGDLKEILVTLKNRGIIFENINQKIEYKSNDTKNKVKKLNIS